MSRGVGARGANKVLFPPGEVGEGVDGEWGTGIVRRILGVKNLRIVRVLESEGWVELDLENFMNTSKDLDGKKYVRL